MTDISTASDEIVGDEADEDEILAEPRFKYSRVLGRLIHALDMDAASSFFVHDKFLAVGFQSGMICFYDHMGNESLLSSARFHKCAVSCISIDVLGNYFVSCANDFTVNIFGIGCTEYNQRLTLPFSAKIVSIASDFSRQGSNQRFIVGARDLIFYERGMRAELFSGKRRETILYKGLERDGLIAAIAWEGRQYVAFTNETGTRVYDLKLGRSLTLVQPFHKMEQYSTAKFPPKLNWIDSSTLAIGWVNTICVCAIQTGLRRCLNNPGGPTYELPVKHGQVLHKFVLSEFYIAGLSFTLLSNSDILEDQLPTFTPISPSNSMKDLPIISRTEDKKWNELVVFGIKCNSEFAEENRVNELSRRDVPFSTQLLLLRPTSIQDFMIIAEDTIEMRNVDLKHMARFAMCSLVNDNLYFLISAREMIEAIPCSIDDRISWFMENGLFEDALKCALRNNESLRDNSVLEVGKRLINHLIERNEYDLAASYLPQVCSRHKEEWEFYVNEFERHHQILKLVPVVPTKDPQLEPECYETILLAALYTRPKLFDAIVSHWDAEIYRAHSVKDEVFARITEDNRNKKMKNLTGKDTSPKLLLSEEDRGYVLHGLATLLLQLQDYENAIKTYLLLADPAIFGVINRHKLFSYIVKDDEKRQEYIRQLMEINQAFTIRLLLDNEDLLPHDDVVKLLGHDPKIQMNYLLLLQSRGEGTKYSDKLVKLLANHKREALLPFLRKNEYYKLDVALEVCKTKDYIEEMVYLLGRSGNRFEALDLMVNKLRRIEMAIEFCAENGDSELWKRMIESALNHPDHITCLLSRTASVNINPLDLIEKIPQNMEIPGLQSSLLQVLRDYELQIRLLDHSCSIASTDAFDLIMKRFGSTAFVINNYGNVTEMRCEKCSAPLICTAVESSSSSGSDVHLLANGAVTHKGCANPCSMPTSENHSLD